MKTLGTFLILTALFSIGLAGGYNRCREKIPATERAAYQRGVEDEAERGKKSRAALAAENARLRAKLSELSDRLETPVYMPRAD